MPATKQANKKNYNSSSELHHHISKIDKLRKRYEIITVSMNPPEGEEKHSQAYYVIKAAQEREELQRHGDELDSKIKKAEKEIRYGVVRVVMELGYTVGVCEQGYGEHAVVDELKKLIAEEEFD